MSFAEQLAARAKEKEAHNNVSKPQQQNTIKPRPGKIKLVGSSVFADQLRKSALSSSINSSCSDKPIRVDDDLLHKKQPSQRSLIPKNTSSFDSEGDEYSSVGFSLMDVSTDKSIYDDGIESKSISSSTQPSVSASFKTKRKKKIRPISKSTETTLTKEKPHEIFQNVELSPIKSYTTQESDDTTTSKAKHAWAQIESLKTRVREADERAKSERQRAEEVSFELQRVKEKQDHDRQKVEESTNQYYKGEDEEHLPQQEQNEEAEALQWKKRALEAEERLIKEVERLERAATRTNSSRFDETDPDIIHLKNAEIDGLRSQIQRLERRLQVERERSDEMYMLNRDTPPLVVAECSATQSSNDEYRMLRNEIRHLQYQLGDTSRRGGGATGSTGESTLSTLDDANDYPPTNVETADGEDEVLVDEEDAQASSCWCSCFRGKSKRGYGRV